jgi:hypothetical protein
MAAETQLGVANHLGISRRLVADLVGNGTFTQPLKLDQCRKAYIARLQERAAGRERRERHPKPSLHGNLGRAVLDDFVLPEDFLVPWSVPPDRLLTVPQYEKHIGVEHGEIIDLMGYGLPILPPEPGKKLARVSVEHAERYRFLLAVLLHRLGGPELLEPERGLERLAPELHRMRGVVR